MAFPTLVSMPLIEPYKEGAAEDPVIRSGTEGGYEQTRPRYTRVPEKWHIEYADLSDSDKALVKAWELAVMYGAYMDTWSHPKTSTSYNVRLAAPIEYAFNDIDNVWKAVFDLKQV